MAVKARRKAFVVDVGGVKVGGEHPIVVQSMTNTDTVDVPGTVNQVMALARAGSELVHAFEAVLQAGTIGDHVGRLHLGADRRQRLFGFEYRCLHAFPLAGFQIGELFAGRLRSCGCRHGSG